MTSKVNIFRDTLDIKEVIVDKVKNERNDWFAKVYSQGESNIARKTLSIDILQVRRRGRPKQETTREEQNCKCETLNATNWNVPTIN